MSQIRMLAVVAAAFLFDWKQAQATIYYVKQGGTGNGSTWSSAYGTLQAALAVPPEPFNDEI